MDEIRALQLGGMDWNVIFHVPDYVDLSCYDYFIDVPKKPYDVVFVNKTLLKEEIANLMKASKAYTVFVTENANMTDGMTHFMKCRCAKKLANSEIQNFFDNEIRDYFGAPYGEKFSFRNLGVNHNFKGNVVWNGNHDVTFQGDFSEEMKQIAFWKNTIPFMSGQTLDFWIEYQKKGNVEIEFRMYLFQRGDASSNYQKEWIFKEDALDDIITVTNEYADGPLFISIYAKGEGELSLTAVHDRHSRRGKGYFLPGGERLVTKNREEVFFYFDPGDMKPPLNVYFSGYKTRQGFEGYNMLKKMGCPFLLISEPRLEGGSFYMGSEEYETMIYHAVEGYMQRLGMTGDEVIFSGLSMGTYGALYYGCDIRPHALILGKPLASIGNVAGNETLGRPGGFPTSLDVLMFLSGNTTEEAKEELNQRFWKKFDATNWQDTKFVVSYMIEDDYDGSAYQDLIRNLKDPGVSIYGKGIHGRHNDNSDAIVSWFLSQYEKILEEDFGRKACE